MEDFGGCNSSFLALHVALELCHNPGEREECGHTLVNVEFPLLWQDANSK